MNWEEIKELEKFIYFIVEMKNIIIIAFITQFIVNIMLILKIPKMLKYQKRIFQKLYNFELEHKIDMEIENIIEEKEQENIKKYLKSFQKKEIIEYTILIISIVIITVLIFINFK